MLRGKRKVKLIAMIVMFNLLAQIILPILSTEVFATEEVAEGTETTEANQEITRNYEIKEEETWDVSANNDGSVMAKWTRSDRTIVISGAGEMKDWEVDSKEDWHDISYTKLIAKVVIEEGITNIGNCAFYKCSSLESVTIPNGVISIGEGAFYKCSSLNNITIPDGVISIENNVFGKCTSLESIAIPKGVTNISSYAFHECTSLEEIKIDKSNKNYMDEDGVLYSKDKKKLIRYPEGKKDIIEYNILEGVTSIGKYAFYGCSNLESITIPENVTSIGNSAFYGCSNLESITIPENVTSIGNSAFSGCSSLANINIPSSVTSIRYGVFRGCSSLVSINIPSSVTAIEESAFKECSSLVSISIPNSVTTIGSKAFEECGSLVSISIPNSVTTIGSKAFYKCSSLVSISIPNSVTTLKGYAFYKCSSLASITIPEGVTSIGYNAFEGCSSLVNINIPSSVTSIESRTFNNCSSLTNITIPDSVTTIGKYAIPKSTIIYAKADSEGHRYAEESEQGYMLEGEASNLTTNYEIKEEELWDVSANNDGSVMAKWTKSDRTIVISGKGNMKNWVFSSKEDWHNTQYTSVLKNVVIEEGITCIGCYAFSECSSLVSISIPNGVASIGMDAFSECSSLASISIPNGLASINAQVFYRCSSLVSISIPNGVTRIDANAFKECTSLKTIIIPSSVTTLEWGVFDGCSSLGEIKVNENNEKYMDENGILFMKDKKTIIKYPEGKKDVTEYTIPEEVTNIGKDAFLACTNLVSITIPEGVTNIGNSAFSGCSNLTGIIIPNSVTSIGMYAFYECRSLASIIIPSAVTSIGSGAFSYCSSLENIIIPEGVTSIGLDAFHRCISLTSITISSTVTSIGNNAIDKTTFIYAKANTEAHRYAEENQQGYILDDIAPNITYTPNDGSKAQKKYEIKIDVVDNGVGLNESSLKYEWTQSATGPAKEKLSQTFNNGDIIKKSDGDGKWYLWVYAKDNLENQVITSKEFNFDNTAPNILSVTGNPTEMTNQNVTVTITSDEQLQKVEGWNLSEDKQALTKEYSENATETVKIKDLAGNESNAQVKITNIDKIAPTCKVTYSTTQSTKENVTVTITSNEKLQEVQGWTLSQDKLKLTKQYSENKEETITLKDLVGNESKVSIKVANIVKEPETLKGDINKDGQINTVDMIKMLRHIAVTKNQETEEKNPTWKLTGETFTIADINEDGQVNTTDLLKILRHISASKDDEIKEKHPDWILN